MHRLARASLSLSLSLFLFSALAAFGACSSGDPEADLPVGGSGGGIVTGKGGSGGAAAGGGARAGAGGGGIVTQMPTVNGTTATVTATVPGEGLATFVWGTSPQPTIQDHVVGATRVDATTVSAQLTNLVPCTTYYVRVLVSSLSPTGGDRYGTEVMFTVPGSGCPSSMPPDGGTSTGPLTVTTVNVAVLVAGASVTVELTGSADAKEAGIVWGKTTRPTVDVVAGGGKTVHSGELMAGFSIETGKLDQCTKYYVRGYAAPISGAVVYGNELTFMTPGLITDCHPFNGYWQNSDGTVVLKGSSMGLTFDAIAPGSSTGWYEALQKNLISLGSYFIKDVQASGSSWTASVLWKASSSSKGVYDVKFSPGSTITLSTDQNTMYIDSDNPFGGFGGTATLTRKPN
jgi:hypothetical protein